MNPATVLCRCEDIRGADVLACIALGARDPDAVKRLSRFGMGLCQGRYCRAALIRFLAEEAGLDPRSIAPMRVRSPIVPIPAGTLHD
ncbi:MAG TPA: (2Fe-2S)-binding protein [Bacillota bacterium]|nr:(2Fe-2S)-binding protein [Bacillota bacterium]